MIHLPGKALSVQSGYISINGNVVRSNPFNDPENWEKSTRGDSWAYIPTIRKFKERFAAIKIQDFWHSRNMLTTINICDHKLKTNISKEDREKVIKIYKELVLIMFYKKVENKYPGVMKKVEDKYPDILNIFQ